MSTLGGKVVVFRKRGWRKLSAKCDLNLDLNEPIQKTKKLFGRRNSSGEGSES